MKLLLLFLIVNEGKSPGKAVLLSALLPGGGQFYTGHYVRGALYFAGETFFGGRAIVHLHNYSKNGSLEEFNRFLSDGFWFLTIWGFSLVDAYVSAHLYKFEEINKRVVFRMTPTRFCLEYHF